MADVTLSYKGSDILELSNSGSATLKTGGKYCEDDIAVEYVKPSGGGDFDELIDGSFSGSITTQASFIRDYAFHGCTNITEIVAPNVTKIGAQAFTNTSITVFVMEKFQDKFDAQRFRGCPKLETVVFKKGCQRLGNYDFYQTPNLETIDLGASESTQPFPNMATIYQGSNIQNVILRDTTLRSLQGAFDTSSPIASATFYVPSALIEDYKVATNWSTYANQFETIEGSQYDGYWANGEAITS